MKKVTEWSTQLPANVKYLDVWKRPLGHLRCRPATNSVEPPLLKPFVCLARPARGVRIVAERGVCRPLRIVVVARRTGVDDVDARGEEGFAVGPDEPPDVVDFRDPVESGFIRAAAS